MSEAVEKFSVRKLILAVRSGRHRGFSQDLPSLSCVARLLQFSSAPRRLGRRRNS